MEEGRREKEGNKNRKAASPPVSEFGRRHAIICGGKKRGLGEARSGRRRERVEGGREGGYADLGGASSACRWSKEEEICKAAAAK